MTDFVTRHFGREVNDWAVEPFVAGIFAGDPDQLSVQSAFPMLAGLEARYGSLLRGALKMRKMKRRAQKSGRDGGGTSGRSGAGGTGSDSGADRRQQSANHSSNRSGQLTFQGGVGALPGAIADALGDRLVLGACATGISRTETGFELSVQHGTRERRLRAQRLVLATPAYSAAELVGELDPLARDALSAISYPPVLTISATYPESALTRPLEGFGMLIPRAERRRILGVIFASSVFPHRSASGQRLFTVFVGGSRDSELLRAEPEDRLLRRSLAETQALLGIHGDPTLVRHSLWDRAIPQYTFGHRDRMAVLSDAEERLPGLRFLGNYRGGVAVTNCLSEARRVAISIHKLVKVQRYKIR